MKKVVIWGTGEKCKSFLKGCIDCEILFIVDNDKEKQGGGVDGYSVKLPEEAEFSQVEYIIICSQYYDEILKQIEEMDLCIKKDSICIYDVNYYNTRREIRKSALVKLVKAEYIERFEDYLIEKEQVRNLEDAIISELRKESEQPLSCYARPNSPSMAAFAEIWRNMLHERNLEVIYQNRFGFKTFLDVGLSIAMVIKYDFPCDAYPLAAFIKDCFPALKCTFDVGANRGIVTCLLAQISEEVHAFEPSLEVSKLAKKNIELNGFHNITWNNCGVGNNSVRESYYDYGLENSGHNSFINQKKENSDGKTDMIQMIKLDDYCMERNIDEIDLLKMDVEGYEPFVIEGSINLIKNKKIHCICLEVSPMVEQDEEKQKDMLALLDSYGYIFCDMHHNRLTISDICHIKFHQDIACMCE